jgi:predicted DNA-binding transcriptional regulator AlpA
MEQDTHPEGDLPFRLRTYDDLARITSESVATHRRREKLGTGPQAIRVGRHVRFTDKSIRQWLVERGAEV